MPLKDLLAGLFGPEPETADPAEQKRMAAAVLLVEISRADMQMAEAELAVVRETLAQQFGLSRQDVDALLREARTEQDNSVSMQPYVAALNASASHEEKRALLQALWRVAYADGVLDQYEEHMMRRISELLFLSHADFIQTKLAVTGD